MSAESRERKMEKNVIAIIADGEKVNNIRRILKDADIIIAADGGANLCKLQKVKPDYIIGDLDSITYENMEFFSDSKFIEITEQENTDLQKALNYALSLNPTKIKIISSFGKRADHTLGNILIFQNMLCTNHHPRVFNRRAPNTSSYYNFIGFRIFSFSFYKYF